MSVAELVDEHRDRLTAAERRVADVVLQHPQAIAFGTVADIAKAAEASGATVVRLAAKLGYDGFTALQSDVQDELRQQLRPAAERIRQAPPSDLLVRAMASELDNVQTTIEAVDRAEFGATVRLLADRRLRVAILSGDASRGVGMLLADGLGMLRPGVELLGGSNVRVTRALAELDEGDVVLAIDLRRYERWVLAAARRAARRDVAVVAITDSTLSPLAELAQHSFVVRAEGPGPFDSHVGTLALANALVAGVAARLQQTAARRLDRVENAWREAEALVER